MTNYEELYKKAMLHIVILQNSLDNQIELCNFYKNEVKILHKKLKELNNEF